MIKYNLLCKKCNLVFDSWFASSKEYDKLKKKNFINCHGCGSIKVEKNLMAPKLISKNLSHKTEKKDLLHNSLARTGTDIPPPVVPNVSPNSFVSSRNK